MTRSTPAPVDGAPVDRRWASVDGFILQATYRIHGGAPVVYLYGVTADGVAFLVRDHRETPHFYIPAADADRARRLGASRLGDDDRRTFDGRPVSRVEVAIPADAPPLRDRLQDHGIETFEADVRFAVRYLIDRDVRGACRITGVAERQGALGYVFDDPDIVPSDVATPLRLLAFDIETDPSAATLLAISVYDGASTAPDDVVVVDAGSRAMPSGALGVANERDALDWFCAYVARVDPDILTGWNVIDFDLSVLAKVAERVRHPLALGRDAGALRIRPARGYFGSGQANIPGRVVLDGMDLVRGAFLKFDDYALDTVAREVLGEGKVDLSSPWAARDAPGKAEQILERYRNDLDAFVRYARTDARLAYDIVDTLELIDLTVARSRLTGMTPDRVSASIASFDFLYLSKLVSRRIVAPTVRSSDSRVGERQSGGYVFEPVVGIHDWVGVFDFKSLYPSLMRTFNIDPLGFVSTGDDLVEISADAAFRREPAILPSLLDELTVAREAAKGRGDGTASQAIKILMNSCYGVLGTPACRFHNVHIANAITSMGRHFLLWSKDWFEARDLAVLYGDTDSVFVALDRLVGEGESLRAEAAALVQAFNRDVTDYIADEWRVASRLELEFEKLYRKLFLPSVRHGGAGARKRYAGLIDGRDDVEFVGMEVVRRDWTDLAKSVQRDLYRRLFRGEPVAQYLAETTAQLRRGELDHLLVYRKGLRKAADDYTATTPPHVVAARKSATRQRVIAYVMTQAGPEPVDALANEPDREHYLEKQIRPVAEPVLSVLGESFERVVGDDKQLALF